MDKEHVKSAAKKTEGEFKKAAGKATDNKKLEAEGHADKAEGKAREVAGDVKDTFKNKK